MRKAFSRSEDFWAISIGIVLLFFGLFAFSGTILDFKANQQENQEALELENLKESPFKSVEWWDSFNALKRIKASDSDIGKFLGKLTGKPVTWTVAPLQSFYLSEKKSKLSREKFLVEYDLEVNRSDSLKKIAIDLQTKAEQSYFENEISNLDAEDAIADWLEKEDDVQHLTKKITSKKYNKIPWLFGLAVLFSLLFGIAYRRMHGAFWGFMKAFFFVFLIATVSFFLAANASAKSIGFGYAAWAILIGLFISNTFGTPNWVKCALQTELYIKTGLVILGAEILIGKILAIGLPGIFVAWIVTPVVLVSTYWFGQKVLKIGSKTLNITISADMSVCGVSAAVATAAASNATKEELTIAVGLSMIFTSVMMIVLPGVINWFGMPEVMGGAWIGGTIDATGAVVAAGAFLGETALSVAATIKMIQNILIGLVAFGVAIYFARTEGTKSKISWGEIWLRFPKFIIGFIGASLVFSLIYALLNENTAYSFIDQGVIGGFSKNIRGWLFCLAFVSIGLSINFKAIKKHFTGGKPLILYAIGQSFNLALTLLMVYIMFYLVFPNITQSL